MATGSSSPGARRRPGRFRFVLFMLLLIFGAGFYTGVQSARRALRTGPAWARRALGLTEFLPPPPAVPPSNTPSNTLPIASAPVPQQPAPVNPATGGAPAVQPNTAPTTPSQQHNAAPGSLSGAAVETETPLDKQAREYDDLLNRIQDYQRKYTAVYQKTTDPKTRAQDLGSLQDEQNVIYDDMTAVVQRALALQTTLKSDPQFATRYEETRPVLNPDQIPSKMLDMNLETLQFVQKRP